METKSLTIPSTTEERGELELYETMAPAIAVTCEAEYGVAGEFLARIKTFRKAITDKFRPVINAANALTASIRDLRNEIEEPAAQVEKRISDRMSAYRVQVEAEARRKQLEAETAARKAAEEAKLAEVREVAASGQLEEATRILERPVQTPIVPTQVAAPTSSFVTFTRHYYAEVTDANLVPREWCEPNQKALDAHARATKGTATIPGVKFCYRETAKRKPQA